VIATGRFLRLRTIAFLSKKSSVDMLNLDTVARGCDEVRITGRTAAAGPRAAVGGSGGRQLHNLKRSSRRRPPQVQLMCSLGP